MIAERIRRFLKDLDYYILIPVFCLCLLGLFCIHSATTNADAEKQFVFTKQLVLFGLGIIILLAVILTPIRYIDSLSFALYVTALILLIGVMLFGSVRYGARRWFVFGPINLQPSEIAKIATILFIARILALRRINTSTVSNMTITLILIAVPMLLIMRQPDLGTALCIGAVAFPMLYHHGISLFPIFVMFSPIATVIVHIGSGYSFDIFMLTLFAILIVLYYSRRSARTIVGVFLLNVVVGLASEPLWDSLQDYQKERILTFLNPERDAKGAGYQVLQSQIAIGAGGVIGRGYMEGTQTQLKFLPEQHTDFIFAVVGEEFGLIGGIVVIGLLLAIVIRMLMIADVVDDKFASLTLVGIASLFAFQMVVNIGMTSGIMPVTGIPLPFISYGGTALWTNLTLVGIAVNISMRKKVYDIH
jgi:rod shape determining protein RodA